MHVWDATDYRANSSAQLGLGRDFLGRLLDGFEAALSLQDAEAIARHRQALEEFLNRHDAGAGGPDAPEDEDDWYRP